MAARHRRRPWLPDGSWSFTLSGLTDGTSYSAVAIATDPAGNTAASAPLSFITDVTTPILRYLLINPNTGLSTGGGVSVDTDTFTAAGFVGDSQPGTGVEVFATLNGSSQSVSIGMATVDAGGNFRISTQPLADGEYIFSVVATDVAGNVTTLVGPYGVTVNTTAPAAPALSDASVVNGYVNATNDSTAQALAGTASAGDKINVYLNGAAPPVFNTTADGSGNWSVTLGRLVDGSYSYTATATDSAASVSALSAPYSFTVDTSTTESAIADRAVTTGTDGQSYINAANFNGDATTLTGMAEAGDTVSVMINGGAGQAATVAADGSWSLTLTGLADSESVSAVATATDPAGNTATSVPFAFTVDTTPPALPTVSNLADFLNASYDVGFTVTAGAAVTVDVNGSLLSPAQLSADFARTTGFVVDNYTAQPDDFVGTETIVVSATLTDAAGNISAPGTLTLKPMDTTPPATPTVTLPLSYVGTGATGHWKIGGAAEAGSTVTVSDGSTNWSTVATGGAWSVATTDNNAAIRSNT